MRGFCDQRGTLGDTNWAVVITYSAGIDPKSVGGAAPGADQLNDDLREVFELSDSSAMLRLR